MNPGSGIDFVSPRDGWRLDGQDFGPAIDDNLGTGIVDNGAAWPGTSISRTVDAGRHWSTILRRPTGIWGMDLLPTGAGFAVGVTGLLRTDDSGESWRHVGEPVHHTLVWVGFSTPDSGIGLTTIGTLVRSTDGGKSWSSVGFQVPGRAVCLASPTDAYLAAMNGALYRGSSDGSSWHLVRRAPPRVEQFIGPWAELSCNGPSVWLGLSLLCAAACAGTSPYAIEHSGDGGVSWTVVVNSWPGLSGGEAPASGYLKAVAASQSGAGVFVFEPAESGPGPSFEVVLGDADGQFVMPRVPALPPGKAELWAQNVRGSEFLGHTGWLYFDDTDVTLDGGTGGEPIIWRTPDGGREWHMLWKGAPEMPPKLAS